MRTTRVAAILSRASSPNESEHQIDLTERPPVESPVQEETQVESRDTDCGQTDDPHSSQSSIDYHQSDEIVVEQDSSSQCQLDDDETDVSLSLKIDLSRSPDGLETVEAFNYMKRFLKEEARGQMASKFLTLVQTPEMSFCDYATQMLGICDEIAPEMSERARIQFLTRGLSPELAERARLEPTDKLHSFLLSCMKWDIQASRRRAERAAARLMKKLGGSFERVSSSDPKELPNRAYSSDRGCDVSESSSDEIHSASFDNACIEYPKSGVSPMDLS